MEFEDLVIAFGRMYSAAWILGMDDETFTNYMETLDKVRKDYRAKLAERAATSGQKSGLDTGEHRE